MKIEYIKEKKRAIFTIGLIIGFIIGYVGSCSHKAYGAIPENHQHILTVEEFEELSMEEKKEVFWFGLVCGIGIGISLGIVIENVRGKVLEWAEEYYNYEPEINITIEQCPYDRV